MGDQRPYSAHTESVRRGQTWTKDRECEWGRQGRAARHRGKPTLEFPIAVVQGANVTVLEPARNAVEVECVVANTPGHSALFAGGPIGLALDACTRVGRGSKKSNQTRCEHQDQ